MDDPGNDLWGVGSCRRKCGNGILEASYDAYPPGTGTFYEECDLGSNNNDGDVYYHACSTTCKKKGTTVGVDFHLWKCETAGVDRNAKSTCTFLCGNDYLDTANKEPCDRLDQPYTASTAATKYVGEFATGYANWKSDPK
jgi:hypothetical protein